MLNLKRATLNLSVVNIVSIALGLAFHILLGRQFGVSQDLDCLFVSLTIYSLIGIFNSFFTSLFIPIFNEIKHSDEKESLVFIDVTIKWVAIFAMTLTLAVWLSGDLIISVVASGFKDEGIALALDITRILFITFVLSSISNMVGCILNALYFFSLPAISGLLHPVLNIISLYVLAPRYGVKAIAISYLAANLIQTCVLLIYLYLKTNWRPTRNLYHNKLLLLVRESAKMTASGFIWSFKDVISRNIASHLAPGAITLLFYAEKIINVLHQVTISPPARIFYSKMSEWIIVNKWTDIRELFEKMLRLNIALTFFLSSAIIVFLVPLLKVLLLGSKFIINDIHTLFYLVLIMVIYLITISIDTYLVQTIYAERKSNVSVANAAAGIAVFSISASLLSRAYGIYGVAISIPLTQIVDCFLNYYFLNEQLQASLKHLIKKTGKGFVIAVIFTVIGTGAKDIINKDSLVLLIVLPIWVAFYLVSIKLFMKKELEIIGLREIFRSG